MAVNRLNYVGCLYFQCFCESWQRRLGKSRWFLRPVADMQPLTLTNYTTPNTPLWKALKTSQTVVMSSSSNTALININVMRKPCALCLNLTDTRMEISKRRILPKHLVPARPLRRCRHVDIGKQAALSG